jgi:hypothetical protein
VPSNQEVGDRYHPEKTVEVLHVFTVPAFSGHLQSSRLKERTGYPTMTQLNHVEMQDCLSWWRGSVLSPVWQRSFHSTQCLPVMGLAARAIWISQGISSGNTDENQTLRGRETILEAHKSTVRTRECCLLEQLPIRPINFQLSVFQAARREQRLSLAIGGCPSVTLTRV